MYTPGQRGKALNLSAYLDSLLDKSYITFKDKYCGYIARLGQCKNGHCYLKVIYCGKEWCWNCREIFHNRRIARWWPKVMTMGSFGSFVFTIPKEMREFYKDREHLSELRRYLNRRFKQLYPGIKALCRWHWFGNEKHDVYKPHFNVLVSNFGKLPKKELEKIKRNYKNALERYTGIKLNGKVDVYYHYSSPEGIKKECKKRHEKLTDEKAQERYQNTLLHKLWYLTKATFTVYNQELAKKLKNYPASSVWGRFRKLTYEEIKTMKKQKKAYFGRLKKLDLLMSGHCPACGNKVHWLKNFCRGTLSSHGQKIGAGYYYLPEIQKNAHRGSYRRFIKGR
ncbi:hypothetical protein ES702_02695 [subsurface metagenome]